MVDPRDGRQFAVKFFLQEEAFQAEATLYAACFPCLRSELSARAVGLCRSLVDKGNMIIPDAPRVIPPCKGNASINTIVTQAHSVPLPYESGPRTVYSRSRSKDSACGVGTESSGKEAKRSESASLSTLGVGLCLAGDGGSHSMSSEGPHALTQHEGFVADSCYSDARHVPDRIGSTARAQEGLQVPAVHQTQQITSASAIPLHSPASLAVQGGAAEACARFLPQVETICHQAVDPRGRPLPPCIVMEKGESLQDWSNRADPDLFTSLGVRPEAYTHVQDDEIVCATAKAWRYRVWLSQLHARCLFRSSCDVGRPMLQ